MANLRTATFDLPRMGLTTTQPLEAILTTDGPAEVRLAGAGPVLAEGAEIRQTGADAVIVLPEAGTYTVTLVADPDGGGGDGEEPPDPGEEPDPEEGTPGTWFLHRDDIDCQTRQTSLRPTPGSGEALCYEPLQPVNEVFVRTGAQPPLRLSFPAGEVGDVLGDQCAVLVTGGRRDQRVLACSESHLVDVDRVVVVEVSKEFRCCRREQLVDQEPQASSARRPSAIRRLSSAARSFRSMRCSICSGCTAA